ncbi:hypothetical protein IQ276_019955 [Desmonostoc muscorum LEGE 12446]|uniref:Transmembrane protein n=1 Tax=Desmonostoc muscorum LEGE 12446 TaxID=1828758 RepID=A0A8J7A3B9_DESMC|nr:hypothetical protein [Desmonostoc muscorum]MCF2148661.1 hypothetical protein [Desmonostoc muscorum LEGE 12446]
MTQSNDEHNKEYGNLQRMALFSICLPGLILSVYFALLSIISIVNAHKEAYPVANNPVQEKQKPNNSSSKGQQGTLNVQLEALEKKMEEKINGKSEELGKQIEIIDNQQQNFITNGQGTLNFLLTVIIAFAGYNAFKESFLNAKDKNEIRQELEEKIKQKLKPLLKKELEAEVTEKLNKRIKELEQNIEVIQINGKWIEFELAVIAAEQLDYKPGEKPYYIIAALYQHLRAIGILGELEKLEKDDSPETLLEYEFRSVKEIYDILKKLEEENNLSNSVPELNPEQAVKLNKMLREKIPEHKHRKISDLEQIIEKITIG